MIVKSKVRIFIDVLMTIMLFIQMAYFYSEQQFHEWVGIMLFILFIFHHIINFRWIRNMFKGSFSLYRMFQIAVNAGAFLLMMGLILSGLTMSLYAFPNEGFGISILFARKLHMVSSYGSFILLSVHLGMHWGVLAKRLRYKEPVLVLIKIATVVIAGYGIYALLHHDLIAYIFLIEQYVFFDMDQPLASFLLDYVAIMGLWVWIAYYLTRVLKKIRRK